MMAQRAQWLVVIKVWAESEKPEARIAGARTPPFVHTIAQVRPTISGLAAGSAGAMLSRS